MDPTRRFLLRAGSSLPAAAALSSLPAMAATRYAASMQIPATTVAPDVLARDENYWAAVASHFDITDEVNHRRMATGARWAAKRWPVTSAIPLK